MTNPSRTVPPDVILVIADCARSLNPTDGRPMVEDLVAETPTEFVRFPKAVTAATWSLPSHASLFTGLYPWNHGCHSLAGLPPLMHCPTIAGRLKLAGYSTGSFSGNSVLAPETGLLDGFDFATWGRWSENIFRLSTSNPPHRSAGRSDGSAHRARGQSMLVAGVASTLRHVPAIGFAVTDLVRRLRRGDGGKIPLVSPWIEPAFDAWVGTVPGERRLFSVVNFMDFHEPYVPESSVSRPLGKSIPFSFVPQDGRSYSHGPEQPPAAWIEQIRDLYSASGRMVGHRIRSLWDTLHRHGRDRNTLFIVTSDHGQSLGEDGWFFHSHGQTEDELTRVPLAIHFPDSTSQAAGETYANDWVSLTDLSPTIAEIAGIGIRGFTDGVSLVNPQGPSSARTVLSAGDGTIGRSMENGGPGRPSHARRTASCAAYSGEREWVVSGNGPSQFEVRRYATGPPRARLSANAVEHAQESLATTQATRAIVSMLTAAPQIPSADVSRRLATWGYG
ncbi:MAG: sulfatase-like hydrolase/transferase [Thermoplasmata archaeon]